MDGVGCNMCGSGWAWDDFPLPSVLHSRATAVYARCRSCLQLQKVIVWKTLTEYLAQKQQKLKVRTLDVAPLHETPLQKCSSMARVLKGSRSFAHMPTCSSTIGMSHSAFCLLRYGWYSFTNPGGMQGWVSQHWGMYQWLWRQLTESLVDGRKAWFCLCMSHVRFCVRLVSWPVGSYLRRTTIRCVRVFRPFTITFNTWNWLQLEQSATTTEVCFIDTAAVLRPTQDCTVFS